MADPRAAYEFVVEARGLARLLHPGFLTDSLAAFGASVPAADLDTPTGPVSFDSMRRDSEGGPFDDEDLT